VLIQSQQVVLLIRLALVLGTTPLMLALVTMSSEQAPALTL
jgi:hypothetical protein